MAMRRIPNATALLLGLAGAPWACAGAPPMPELEGGIEVALQRGSGWSTMMVRPPYIIGRSTSLTLSPGRVRGSNGSGIVGVALTTNEATGQAPGRVQLGFARGEDEFLIEGTWNGQLARVRTTPRSLHANIFAVLDPNDGFTLRGDTTRRGRSAPSPGDPGVVHCVYNLDTLGDDGSLSGSSTCHGLPEPTRLEIPRTVQAWLSEPELAILLLVVLSNPTYTTLETSTRNPLRDFGNPVRPVR